MDPVTHIVASIAAGRAGLNKTTRLATPMLIVSAMAGDLDWLTAFAGPRAFLIGHRTVTDSLLGAAAIALITALVFTLAQRKSLKSPVRFVPALGVCAVGAALHILLDFTNSYGVKLLWPFSERWFALDILPTFDMWLLFILLAGILLPMLFRLITEEIGAKPKSRSAALASIFAVVLALVYVGGRYVLHTRAIGMLNSRLYQDAAPITVGAFPDSPSPLLWTGVVVTEKALLRVDVPVALGNFDPLAAKVFYKPDPSAALDAARATRTAALFLSFARFPRARVEKTDQGYHVEITDMRFELGTPPGRSLAALIDLNVQAHVIHEELDFGNLFPR